MILEWLVKIMAMEQRVAKSSSTALSCGLPLPIAGDFWYCQL
jgi:hypothetical protein